MNKRNPQQNRFCFSLYLFTNFKKLKELLSGLLRVLLFKEIFLVSLLDKQSLGIDLLFVKNFLLKAKICIKSSNYYQVCKNVDVRKTAQLGDKYLNINTK